MIERLVVESFKPRCSRYLELKFLKFQGEIKILMLASLLRIFN